MVSVSRKSRKVLLGKKVGMTQIFSEEGKWVPITVLQAGPCAVLQIKTEEQDGYSAYQVGFDDRRKDAKRPQQVCFDKLGINTKHFVREIPFIDPADILTGAPRAVAAEEAAEEVAEAPAEEPEEGAESEEAAVAEEAAEDSQEADSADEGEEQDDQDKAEEEPEPEEELEPATEVNLGDLIGVKVFEGVARVDVSGVSKGRGFTGIVKRHGHSTGDKSHGGKSVRLVGSTGMHTDPGRVAKGKAGPGHYGNTACKTMNLEVVELDEEKNLLLVKGAVPGSRGGYLYIEESLGS